MLMLSGMKLSGELFREFFRKCHDEEKGGFVVVVIQLS